MSAFDAAQHPRAASGVFTDKPQSAPETALGAAPSRTSTMQRIFDRDLAKLNAVIVEAGALVHDGDWVGVDESKLPEDIARVYRGLTQYGYANGLI